MNTIVKILLGTMTGWLTGKLVGKKGYVNTVLRSDASSLDIFFGGVGGYVCDYLFVWANIDTGSLFGVNAATILGSVALVGICRIISGRYFPPPSYKGMSAAAFVKWNDELAVKELTRWHLRRREISAIATENLQP